VAIVRIEQLYPFPTAALEAGARSLPGFRPLLLGPGRTSKSGSVGLPADAVRRAAAGPLCVSRHISS
jgi:hypothetical protein